MFPILKLIPDERERKIRAAHATMERIGKELIDEKQRSIRAGDSKAAGRDLLTLLIQANIDKDVPAHLRMSDDEVLGRTWIINDFDRF